MCATFKSFPALLAALEPQKGSFVCWVQKLTRSHGHRLAQTGKETKRDEGGDE